MSMNCLAYELYWNTLSRNINPVATQQVALDNSLVAPEKRLKIEKVNARIAFSKPQREETYQVTLEALKLSPCYLAFVITTEVLEIYMHQFWTTIKKNGSSDAYNFKLEKKKFRVDTEVFRVICYLQFILIKCTSLGEHLLQSSIDFMYQADNREIISARKEHMPYPRFTKVIINNFISKDKTISMRNRINLYTIRDDSLLGTLKFVSKTQDYHQYGALIPDDMINQDIKYSQAYKTYYYFATGKVPPRKAKMYKKVASPPRKLSPVKEAVCFKQNLSRKLKELRDLPRSLLRRQRDDESWGDSKDDNENDNEDDNDDDVNKGDDDKADSDDDDGDDAHDSERIDSGDDDENPSFTLKDYDEEEHDEEYESDDNNENVFEEKDDDDLYKDVDVRSLGTKHEKERKGDEEMIDADQNVPQEQPYEQVIEDAHVTRTALQKTDDSKQSSFVSSDFANQFLIL
ncbi:hypothetical protein Tco_0975187 [Tanacetum coccineum]|uniref:Uncharacterized protein n=1 Tax=Tanacetum coccineum TaxID=301880 RepID=A0ABQ5EDP1_9ASTR